MALLQSHSGRVRDAMANIPPLASKKPTAAAAASSDNSGSTRTPSDQVGGVKLKGGGGDGTVPDYTQYTASIHYPAGSFTSFSLTFLAVLSLSLHSFSLASLFQPLVLCLYIFRYCRPKLK